jgi:hypothetical protein
MRRALQRALRCCSGCGGRRRALRCCKSALVALCLASVQAQHVELLAPAQGFVSRDGALRVEWAAKDVPADKGALRVVLMVNGLVAQVDDPRSAVGSLLLSALSDGQYRVHVFLGQYDEFEGLSNVQSSALVECWVDTSGVLGGVAPLNPQAGMVPGFTAYVPATRTGAQPGREPVVVFTYHCNRPDFVKMQADALRHFMLDDFTLIVINDAQSDEMRTAISEASRSVGAESIPTPDYLDHSDPSQVVGRIVTWSMQEVALRRFNNSVVMLLEGDIFPVAPFAPLDFLSGYQIAGTQQGRRHRSSGFLLRYLWVGLLLVDLKDLPNKHLLNMDVAVVGDVGGDTASAMHHFFDASLQVCLCVEELGRVLAAPAREESHGCVRGGRSRCGGFCTRRMCIKRTATSTSSRPLPEKSITMPFASRYLAPSPLPAPPVLDARISKNVRLLLASSKRSSACLSLLHAAS